MFRPGLAWYTYPIKREKGTWRDVEWKYKQRKYKDIEHLRVTSNIYTYLSAAAV